MSGLLLVALAFAPGVFALWRVYLKKHYRPDPRHLVVRTFLFGIIAALPIVVVEGLLMKVGGVDASPSTLPAAAFIAFVVAGFAEELGKLLVVKWSAYETPYFSEPMSGLVFSAASALGFASIENVGYMISHGAQVIVPRAVLCVGGHVAFSALWGYAMGVAKSRRPGGRELPTIGVGLVGAIAAHGLYDYYLMKPDPNFGSAVLVFLVVAAVAVFLFRRAVAVSPHKDRFAAPRLTCPGCAAVPNPGARHCTRCGTALRGLFGDAAKCGKCAAPLMEFSRFCTKCGSFVLQ